MNEIEKVEKWLDEIVIGLNFCPFASKPRRNDQIRFVTSSANTSEELLLNLQDELTLLDQTSSTGIETTLLIVPEMLTVFDDYNQFLDLVDQLLIQFEWEGIFQVASFHPDYYFAGTEPDSVENLTNRSPCPILHILREESIEKALENIAEPDEVYKRNIQTMNNLSADQIKVLFPHLKN